MRYLYSTIKYQNRNSHFDLYYLYSSISLDNKTIYDEVITAIAEKKQEIQFIFATHNANIPVLGDAERIFVVDYQDTKIDISQGNIDLKSTQKQIKKPCKAHKIRLCKI